MDNLTKEQVAKIRAFLKKKYIPQIDLQYELADHIACEIEKLQKEDPTLSFEKALHKVYTSFGIYGFTKVRDQKIEELSKRWRKKMIGFLKSYFRLPKIIITIALSVLIYFALHQFRSYLPIIDEDKNPGLFFMLLISIPIISMFIDAYLWRKTRDVSKQYVQLSAITTAVFSTSSSINGVLFYIVYYPLGQAWYPHANWVYVIVSIAIAIGIILRHSMHFIFLSWYEKEKADIITYYASMRPVVAYS